MSVRVDRARLHGGGFDDRARLVDALDQVSPAALGLSPQAVLIVRRLAPRARLTRRGAREPFVASVQEELRRRVVTARRGRGGRDDEDLLFDDDADLQAAIVADRRRALADLTALAPEALAGERRDIAVLIAVAAALVRRPAWLSAPSFARALEVVGQAALAPPSGAAREAASASSNARAGATAVAPTRPRKASGRLAPTHAATPQPLEVIAEQPRSTPAARSETAALPAPWIIATQFGGLFFLL